MLERLPRHPDMEPALLLDTVVVRLQFSNTLSQAPRHSPIIILGSHKGSKLVLSTRT